MTTHEHVCDCGRTRVVVEEPAEYPYGDARDVQCTECGTYVKEYRALASRELPSSIGDALERFAYLATEPLDQELANGAVTDWAVVREWFEADRLAFEDLRAEYHRATGHWPETPGPLVAEPTGEKAG